MIYIKFVSTFLPQKQKKTWSHINYVIINRNLFEKVRNKYCEIILNKF